MTKAEVIDVQTRGRRRVKFEFWLDVRKEDQAEIADELSAMKAERVFAPTIREALRLMFELRQGLTTSLRMLFPMVISDIEQAAYERGRAVAEAQLADLMRYLPREATPAYTPSISLELPSGIEVSVEEEDGEMDDPFDSFVDFTF